MPPNHDPSHLDRRAALTCLGLAAGTAFTLAGGVLHAAPLAQPRSGPLLFVQLSDTHIGFNKAANPDVGATLDHAIDLINGLAEQPALILHTGDITHLSRAEEFDRAQQHLSRLRASEIHATPGEHDVTDGTGAEYMSRFGKASGGRGYYSFDHQGVHFVALVNVMAFKAGGLGAFGTEQLAWLVDDLRGRRSSQPLVIFAHMPMWNIFPAWGWGTEDAGQVFALTRRFGSVTVLNGHIHQIVQKVEGAVTFHTGRSTAYPQPLAGVGEGPGPLAVTPDELPRRLGVTSVSVAPLPDAAKLIETILA